MADKSQVKGGLKRPRVITGAIDPEKTRIAKIATGTGGGMNKSAGMMVDFLNMNAPYQSGYKLDSYRSSYASGLGDRTGAYDIPTYFLMMMQQNGGLIYWPVTLMERYNWFRYFCRTDAYVGRAMELLCDLPMSKLTLTMPKCPKGKKAKWEEILEFFTYQLEVLNMFELCQNILWENNVIGNAFIFVEWDEVKKMWSKAVILPPEEVYVFQYPFSENKRVEYRPQRLIQLIKDGAAMVQGGSATPDGVVDYASSGNLNMRADLERKIVENMPDDIVNMVQTEGCIVMDSDPMTGSFVHHVARRRHSYQDLGASVLERVLVPLLIKEHYRYTQLSLASRNMTPKNLITAPLLMPTEVDALRTQVDLSFLDPEYSVITNYEVNWQQIGPTDRLLDFSREYEWIENHIFAGLGVTRELLTGESTYSGSKITVEILNTMFLMTREILKTFIEKKLFIPICEAHKWYAVGKNGIKKYWYPQVGFNRLTIRDNSEVFDSLYQLYQKGSLPVEVLYELFNLNVDDINAKLRNDMFTVKDSTSNRMVEAANTDLGRALIEKTDLLERAAKYLGLKIKPPEGADGAMGIPGQEGTGFGETPPPPQDESASQGTEDEEQVVGPAENESVLESVGKKDGESEQAEEVSPPESDNLDKLADAIHKELPPGADAEDISAIIDKVSEKQGKTANAKKRTKSV